MQTPHTNILEKLTDDQKDIVVSLPYRAGLWVSMSDVSGGKEANERELKALSNIIHGFAEQVFGAEEIQYIITETIERQDQWPAWEKGISNVLKDCEFTVDVLGDVMEDKSVDAFRSYVLEIGEAVALAFREREPFQSALSRFGAYLGYKFYQMRSSRIRIKTMGFQEYLNISPSERKALNDLARALGTDYQ